MSLRQSAEITEYQSRRVTIFGLGTFGGGVAAARFLASHGAHVTISDLRTEQQLADSLSQLSDLKIAATYLGEHPDAAFDDAELVVVNPAIKPDNPHVQRCRERGAVITSELELFLQHNPAKVIAVTGSNGKSTTAALTHHLLKDYLTSVDQRAWLGGNIGTSLLPDVDQIRADDWVVLEVSSFQLHWLRESQFAPTIAVITNFAPNHLDWHGTLQHSHASKQVLLQRQNRDHVAVIADDAETEWRVRGVTMRFGTNDGGEDGAYLDDGVMILRRGRDEDAVRFNAPPQLPGNHNRNNIAAAVCAAWCAGADPERFLSVLNSFQPLPHRLQLVAEGRGLRFINDSLATTPESAIAALQAFSSSCVIIAGGSDKGADLSAMVDAIRQRAIAVVLIGDTAHKISLALTAESDNKSTPKTIIASDFNQAFQQAVALAPEGSIVLLSPGCASYGWFRDFRERGERFTELALQWLCHD